MRASALALALLVAGALGAQHVGRSVSLDALAPLTGSGARGAIEPAVWGRVAVRLAFWGDRTQADFGSRRDGRRVTTERVRGGSAELRAYPMTLATHTGQRVLPFVSAGLALAVRSAAGSQCITTQDPSTRVVTSTCAAIDERVRRLSPVAAAGLRLLPGRLFLDVSARTAWGGVGGIGEIAHSDWRIGGELALGYTW